jgi:hypothetical protein
MVETAVGDESAQQFGEEQEEQRDWASWRSPPGGRATAPAAEKVLHSPAPTLPPFLSFRRAVYEKSNEITAIPAPLERLDLEGLWS